MPFHNSCEFILKKEWNVWTFHAIEQAGLLWNKYTKYLCYGTLKISSRNNRKWRSRWRWRMSESASWDVSFAQFFTVIFFRFLLKVLFTILLCKFVLWISVINPNIFFQRDDWISELSINYCWVFFWSNME